MEKSIKISPVARSIPFDNSSNGFISTDLQGAIEETNDTTLITASPGLSWGRSGNIPSGTWLQNETVPSNLAGRTVPLADGQIKKIYFANENVNTFTLGIYEHDGSTFTLLTTVTATAQRSGQTGALSVNVTQGKELAVKLTTGSAKNLVVGVIIRGSSI